MRSELAFLARVLAFGLTALCLSPLGPSNAWAADPTTTETAALPQSLLPQDFGPPPGPDEAALVAAHGFPAEQVGFVLFDPATGQIVLQANADRPFVPASVQKIPTMLAGLEVLGTDHRFETQVLLQGEEEQGVLRGAVFFKGGGDPFLTTDDILNLVLGLKDRGLTAVDGGFFYDDSLLPEIPQINARQPTAVPYNPGISALTVNFNEVKLSWARVPDTDEFTGVVLSRSETLDVVTDAVTFALLVEPLKKSIPFVPDYTASTGDRWLLSPHLPAKGEARLPVKHPSLNAARVFRRLAEEQGILLPDPLASPSPTAAKLLKHHQSVPLDKAAQLILRYSNNLSAELVGLATAAKLGTTEPDLAVSSQRLALWLKERMPATDWTGFVAANHSGLSSASRMSPRQIAAILTYVYGLRDKGLDFYALLAPVRWKDELNEGRGKDDPQLAVRAKTGTINFARALAGYIMTEKGRVLGFAVFVMDEPARQAYDARLDVLEIVEVPGARAWMKRARELEKALVTRWAKGY